MRTRQLSGIACVSWIYLCAAFASCAADATSYQDWQFTNSANPAPPTVFTNTAGVPSAAIVVGYAGEGWMDNPGFGTQTGVWDLGGQDSSTTQNTRGLVLLSIPNPRAAGNTNTDFKLRVVQFVLPGLYTGELAFSIPGAVYSGRTIVETVPGPFGGSWVEDQYQWHLTPSPTQVSLTITSAPLDTLLDRIRVDTVSPGGAVPPLSITSVEKSSQGLAITWSGGLPPYQIYATSNLVGSAGWQAVGLPVSDTHADIPLVGPANFVRVGGSH